MPYDSKAMDRVMEGRSEEQLWSITAVTKQTGIGEHTLRSWERRFGFPDPLRLASGHRRYTTQQVRHLNIIAKALRDGHRAGDVVPLSLPELEQLLRAGAEECQMDVPETVWVERILNAARRFDRPGIVESLQREATTMGLPRFMAERLEPLVARVGLAWRAGELEVGHEHFLSEILEDTLRALRTPLEAAAVEPPVLLTTLPGESHSLGLQMAGATIVLAGRSVRILGVQTPPSDVVTAASSSDAVAVGISVSPATANDATVERVHELRERLPDGVRVWVGGAGAAQLTALSEGVRVLTTLEELGREVAVLPRDRR